MWRLTFSSTLLSITIAKTIVTPPKLLAIVAYVSVTNYFYNRWKISLCYISYRQYHIFGRNGFYQLLNKIKAKIKKLLQSLFILLEICFFVQWLTTPCKVCDHNSKKQAGKLTSCFSCSQKCETASTSDSFGTNVTMILSSLQ